MVFVTVRQNNTHNVLHAIAQISEIRQNNVYAGLVLFRKQNPAVDDKDFPIEFKNRHVAANFANSTQWNYSQHSGLQRRRFRQGLHKNSFL